MHAEYRFQVVVIPRPVMIDYLKTVLGMHLGLFCLRVAKQLSGWIRDQQAHPTCQNCPVHGTADSPFHDCPYKLNFAVDMSGDYRSRMAQLAQDSAAEAYSSLRDLV